MNSTPCLLLVFSGVIAGALLGFVVTVHTLASHKFRFSRAYLVCIKKVWPILLMRGIIALPPLLYVISRRKDISWIVCLVVALAVGIGSIHANFRIHGLLKKLRVAKASKQLPVKELNNLLVRGIREALLNEEAPQIHQKFWNRKIGSLQEIRARVAQLFELYLADINRKIDHKAFSIRDDAGRLALLLTYLGENECDKALSAMTGSIFENWPLSELDRRHIPDRRNKSGTHRPERRLIPFGRRKVDRLCAGQV